jgi:hypothetical protein
MRARRLEEAGALELSQVRAARAGKRGRGPGGGAEVGGGPRGAKRSGGRAAISPPKKEKPTDCYS